MSIDLIHTQQEENAGLICNFLTRSNETSVRINADLPLRYTSGARYLWKIVKGMSIFSLILKSICKINTWDP